MRNWLTYLNNTYFAIKGRLPPNFSLFLLANNLIKCTLANFWFPDYLKSQSRSRSFRVLSETLLQPPGMTLENFIFPGRRWIAPRLWHCHPRGTTVPQNFTPEPKGRHREVNFSHSSIGAAEWPKNGNCDPSFVKFLNWKDEKMVR